MPGEEKVELRPVLDVQDATDLYHNCRIPSYYGDRPDQFLIDAEKAFDMKRFPKRVRDRIHSLAYEHGHSAGYSDVVSSYFDFIDVAELSLPQSQEETRG